MTDNGKGVSGKIYQNVGFFLTRRITGHRDRSRDPFVDEILSAKKANPQADTSALESEIDRLVYVLYDLTPDEIAIIEGQK